MESQKKLNKKQKKIYDWLLSKPGYLKKSPEHIILKTIFSFSQRDDIKIALKQARIDYKIHQENTKVPNKIVIKSLKEIFPWVDNKAKFGTEYHPKDVAFKKAIKS